VGNLGGSGRLSLEEVLLTHEFVFVVGRRLLLYRKSNRVPSSSKDEVKESKGSG